MSVGRDQGWGLGFGGGFCGKSDWGWVAARVTDWMVEDEVGEQKNRSVIRWRIGWGISNNMAEWLGRRSGVNGSWGLGRGWVTVQGQGMQQQQQHRWGIRQQCRSRDATAAHLGMDGTAAHVAQVDDGEAVGMGDQAAGLRGSKWQGGWGTGGRGSGMKGSRGRGARCEGQATCLPYIWWQV